MCMPRCASVYPLRRRRDASFQCTAAGVVSTSPYCPRTPTASSTRCCAGARATRWATRLQPCLLGCSPTCPSCKTPTLTPTPDPNQVRARPAGRRQPGRLCSPSESSAAR
eukprot:scaffold62374_cov64-Phaeocystis_antarctica.AAC.2